MPSQRYECRDGMSVTIVPSRFDGILPDEGFDNVRLDGVSVTLRGVVAEHLDHTARGPRGASVADRGSMSDRRLFHQLLQFPRRLDQTVVEEFDSRPVVGDDAVGKVPIAVKDDRFFSLSQIGQTESNSKYGVVKDAAIRVWVQSRKLDTLNQSFGHTPHSQ